MTSTIAASALAIVLLAAGTVLWSAGARQGRIAAAERALLTLQYQEAVDRLDDAGDPGVLTRWLVGDDETARLRAAAAYWIGADEAAALGGDPLLAANASYRAAIREGGPWRAVVARLDDVAGRYAEVLRATPGNEDAAFNYEFVVRHRAAIAARQEDLAPGDVTSTTPHGLAGAPPTGADAKDFKVIVPMLPDERREAEEAGRGGRRIRKG